MRLIGLWVFIFKKGMIIAMNDNALIHYGVKGMKWGVHRYGNSNRSLTSADKKRISKNYKRSYKKAERDLSKKYNKMYVKSYNKAVERMNRGGTNRFNTEQLKKYGKDFYKRDGYMKEYEAFFNNELSKQLNKSVSDFYKKNKNYQKAKSLADKYSFISMRDFTNNVKKPHQYGTDYT